VINVEPALGKKGGGAKKGHGGRGVAICRNEEEKSTVWENVYDGKVCDSDGTWGSTAKWRGGGGETKSLKCWGWALRGVKRRKKRQQMYGEKKKLKAQRCEQGGGTHPSATDEGAGGGGGGKTPTFIKTESYCKEEGKGCQKQ